MVSPKPSILLDKSYLQGATKQGVEELCNTYTVLMTETLFFEIITSTPAKMRACFSKLPSRSNPVEIVPHMGSLIRQEVEGGAPCGPVVTHRLPHEWTFNPKLAEGSFQLTDEQSAGVSQWLADEEAFVDQFLESVALGDRTFPTLAEANSGQRLQTALDLCCELADDRDGVRKFYAATRPGSFPPPDVLTEEWAIFRWYQVNLAAAAEFYARYGPAPEAAREKVLNERLDLDHTAVALLVGRLASRDKTMVRRFRTLRPKGEVLS
jgi:hypothetical protein